jgi:methyltransferase
MIAELTLGFVTLARLVEMRIAQANTARLIATGGYEVAGGHYPLIIAMHVCWLGALWWLAPGRTVVAGWLALFVLLQPIRVWVMAALGPRWTSRIIVVPGETLVRSGPYRLLAHPNYAVVVGEVASLPLAFGLVWVALGFSIANAVMLTIRIRAEDGALASLR